MGIETLESQCILTEIDWDPARVSIYPICILINLYFDMLLVGKVPKLGVFNVKCLENNIFDNWKNHENQKWVK